MAIELFPIQQKAVSKLVGALREKNCAVNASQTGTGKTLMGLRVSRELGLAPLVVAPLAAHGAWEAWSRDLGIPVLGIINPERLRTGRTEWVAEAGPKNYQWRLNRLGHMVLWDEIHRGVSGVRTQTGAMAAMLRPQGIKTLLMSATPFSSPLNMRASGYLLGLHRFAQSDFYAWCARHGCTRSPWHRGYEFKPESSRAQFHLGLIREAIQDRLVRLTVDDMKEFFPESVVEPALISLSDRDTSEIEAIYAEMEEKVRREHHPMPMVELLRARQRAELLSVPAVAEMVQDSLEEGNSVYVNGSFLGSVARLREQLAGLGIDDVRVLTGNTNPPERKSMERDFQADGFRVFLASEAGGMSISLHRVREEQRPRTSIIRPTYKADALQQALGRIYRSGGVLHTPVVQRIVLVAGTVEERVYRRLQAKCRNIAALVDSDLE